METNNNNGPVIETEGELKHSDYISLPRIKRHTKKIINQNKEKNILNLKQEIQIMNYLNKKIIQ